jgi:hypothetical protein
MNVEYSMDNPPIIEFKYLKVGDEFTFKGDKVTVTKMTNDGFFYEPQQRNPRVNSYYMTFDFFMNTPYFNGKYRKYMYL